MPSFDLTKQFVKYGNGYKMEYGRDEFARDSTTKAVTTSLKTCHAASILIWESPQYTCGFSCNLEVSGGAITVERDCPGYNPSDPEDLDASDLKFTYIFIGF